MEQATVNGYGDRLLELIGEAANLDASLACGLRELASEFQYGTLLELLRGEA
jgi:hypothetical protein